MAFTPSVEAAMTGAARFAVGHENRPVIAQARAIHGMDDDLDIRAAR
jgi:hypothetical protein